MCNAGPFTTGLFEPEVLKGHWPLGPAAILKIPKQVQDIYVVRHTYLAQIVIHLWSRGILLSFVV